MGGLHAICTRLRQGHLSVRLGDSSRRSEETESSRIAPLNAIIIIVVVVGFFLVQRPRAGKCISGTGVPRQFDLGPHRDTPCTSHLLSRPVTQCIDIGLTGLEIVVPVD